ncbi:SDR family oxidoreductase [Leptolyngbya sp. AN02str]|uniref:SDR family oxidoreductase n=1 Tax=Leptolyngbya sp. AN02str TaxID=3423363 RepID=UPI003D321665
MKACVAGATGKTGRRIVQALVSRNIPVKALVRNVETARAILPVEAELVVGDVLNPASLSGAIADCTVLFSATGAAPSFDPTGPYKVDYEGTKNLVDAAKAQGIQHFVMVSSLCVSQFFHPLNLFWLILVWKKQAEEYLQKSGLTYTIVRPGGLTEEDNNPDPLVMSSADTLFDGRIPRAKVAEVCVEAVFDPASHNKIVEIVTQADAAAKPFNELFASVA